MIRILTQKKQVFFLSLLFLCSNVPHIFGKNFSVQKYVNVRYFQNILKHLLNMHNRMDNVYYFE